MTYAGVTGQRHLDLEGGIRETASSRRKEAKERARVRQIPASCPLTADGDTRGSTGLLL